MKKSIIILLILVSAAFTQSISAKETNVSGTLKNNTLFTKVYLQNILEQKDVAVADIVDQKYSFTFDIEISDFYKIYFGPEAYLIYIPEPGEKSVIDIDFADIKNPGITSSVHTSLFYTNYIKLESAQNQQEKDNIIKTVIEQNPNSLVSLLFIDDLDISENFDYYLKVSEGLKSYTSNTYVISFQERVAAEKNLAIGGIAPEIALQSPDGKVIALSSLKGKYVLIDFWAAWCRPCRMESPNMVKIYEKYNPKGFEIYSVSFDQEREDWIQAIADDNLGKWTHVSDLKGWQSQAGQTYGVHAIPFTVLLDKEGKIIAKGLRGKSLEDKLLQIFGE